LRRLLYGCANGKGVYEPRRLILISVDDHIVEPDGHNVSVRALSHHQTGDRIANALADATRGNG
jgi:hypothetical protein